MVPPDAVTTNGDRLPFRIENLNILSRPRLGSGLRQFDTDGERSGLACGL
jgi:hypothetical protein